MCALQHKSLEQKIKRFERLADENEALWDMLDKADDDLLCPPELDPETAQHQLAEYMVGNMVRGDA